MTTITETLDQIALEVGTDKASTGHNYTAVYERVLAPMREAHITLCEIGVWEGASLEMWARWLPNATIVGVDVDLSRLRFPRSERVHLRLGDTTDPAFLASLVAEFNSFDVVIDDGAHLVTHHRAAFNGLWPAVTMGGIYIVEDLHTYWWERANAPGSESWLFDLARDAMGRGAQRWEREEQGLPDVASVQFWQSLAVIQRAAVQRW